MLPLLTTKVPGKKSLALAERLQKCESRNVTYISDGFPIFWERASGTNVWDVDGNRYLDLTSGFAVAGLGHGHPEIITVMQEQAAELFHAMGDVHPTELKVRLCEALGEITYQRWGMGAGKTILANSGSEAVEAALKTAFLATGKRGVIAFDGAYHGLGYGSLEASGLAYFRDPFRRQLADFAHLVPYPDPMERALGESEVLQMEKILAQIEQVLATQEIGCILLEPCQGRAGEIVPPTGFLALLRRICDKHKTLLVLDEIYTGFNRTGRLFACDYSEAKPDLICLGKGLTSGFPLSACVGHSQVMDAWPESRGEALHTSTFLGNPLGCRMALESIRLHNDPEIADKVVHTGEKLRTALSKIKHPLCGSICGIGLMFGLSILDKNGNPNPSLMGKIVLAALHDGLILLGGGKRGNVLSFTPPFDLTDEEIEFTAAKLESYFPK